MADLVIDYELLYNAASQLSSLESDVNTIGKIGTVIDYGFVPSTGSGGGVYCDDLGPEPFGRALSNFYGAWQSPLSDGVAQITKLAATFKGVAQAYFDADASQAGGINTGIALSAARNYPQEEASYQAALAEWEQLPNGGVNVPYYTIDGVEHYMTVPRPTPPDQPTGSVTGPTGATTTYSTGGTDPYDPSHGPEITSETTTYTTDGMTYTETTTFGADKGWADGGPVQDTTSTITHSDGSTDTITTTTNLDGSATSVDVNKDNGATTTTTDTRANWNADWVAQPAPQTVNSNGDSPHYQK
jgi:hypothetical protein